MKLSEATEKVNENVLKHRKEIDGIKIKKEELNKELAEVK